MLFQFVIRSAVYFYNAGTYLIQYLCGELENEYLSDSKSNQEQKSLEDILKSVQKHITSTNICARLEPGKEVEVKQTIEWIASLSDKITFKKVDTPGTVTNISTPELPQWPNNPLDSIISFLQNTFVSKRN